MVDTSKPTDTNNRQLTVTIQRGDSNHTRMQTYSVPQFSNQTILDVVSWIQQNEDPTLTYRFACRVGMCGSCAMMVNGIPRWTCRTHIKNALQGNRLEIAPLRNLPVIKDLVTDMDPFFDKWIEAEGLHHSSQSRNEDFAPIKPDNVNRQVANKGVECINCAVCYAACDTVKNNPSYLGPAALLRAFTQLNDDRDAQPNTILDAVSKSGGCHNCHSMGSCTQYCPNELDPMSAISGLKRQTMKRMFRRRN